MIDISQSVYGPVPSWRFGFSLGIDPILLPKKCTLGCIYCQLGSTKRYFSSDTITEQFILNPDDLAIVLEEYLQNIDQQEIDIVTFSGSGEPTLNPNLEELVEVVREYLPGKLVGILSNGTLIDKIHVWRALQKFDVVTLKLDTTSQDLYYHINRPANFVLSLKSMIQYYKRFRKEFGRVFGLEVMAIRYRDMCNIDENNRSQLIQSIDEIDPDIVEIQVPYRPTATGGVQVPDRLVHDTFVEALRQQLGDTRVWSYYDKETSWERRPWKSRISNQSILAILAKRPCTMEDLGLAFGLSEKEIYVLILDLLYQRQIKTREHNDKLYYQIV